MKKSASNKTNDETVRHLATYTVQRYHVDFPSGWNLERYEICKYSNGDYEVFVQAGDRTGGASRRFPLPLSMFQGTFDEFLDSYLAIVPPGHFGLDRKELLADGQVRAFLGFAEKKEHPEVTVVEKPAFALIGHSTYCAGEEGHAIRKSYEDINVAQQLCDSIEEHYDTLTEMGHLRNNGAPAGIWGVMSRNKTDDSFAPWSHFYRCGYYFAGVEADMNSVAAPPWEKWVVPGRTFVIADVVDGNYEEVIDLYTNHIIPEMGMILDGGICEYIELTTKKTTLYFPVKECKQHN